MCAKIKNNKNTLPEVPAGFVYSYIFFSGNLLYQSPPDPDIFHQILNLFTAKNTHLFVIIRNLIEEAVVVA